MGVLPGNGRLVISLRRGVKTIFISISNIIKLIPLLLMLPNAFAFRGVFTFGVLGATTTADCMGCEDGGISCEAECRILNSRLETVSGKAGGRRWISNMAASSCWREMETRGALRSNCRVSVIVLGKGISRSCATVMRYAG